jgi:hypothetical protein
MPALIFLLLFSMAMAVVTGIIVGGGSNTAQLIQNQIEETRSFMEGVKTVVQQDQTPSYLRATPKTLADDQNIEDFFMNTPSIRQLAMGKWGDPRLDSWGNPMRLYMVTQNMPLLSNANNQVLVPVTGFAMVSSGPNRVFETPSITTPVANLSALYALLPPTGSDDIALSFTDQQAQENNFDQLNQSLKQIGSRVMRQYQVEYKMKVAQVVSNMIITTTLQSLDNLQINEQVNLLSDAPRLPNIKDTTVSKNLGIEENIAFLEQEWPLPPGSNPLIDSRGKLLVSSTIDATGAITIRLTNDPIKPSPWPIVSMSMILEKTM